MPLTIAQRLEQAGVHRIVLPMRSDNPAMDHVNAWRVSSQAIFDTGSDNAQTRSAWLLQPDIEQIEDVYCTHAHPDHMGLAHHFADTLNARVHLSGGEMELVSRAFERSSDIADQLRQSFLRDMGGLRAGATQTAPLGGGRTIPPLASNPLVEGQRLNGQASSWRVTLGAGHSICPALFIEDERGIMVTGDQILPDMAPFVGVSFEAPDADPVGDMLAFLDTWADLDATIIALPGHGAPFTDVSHRVRAHMASYERRLARVWAATNAPTTCADLLTALFRVRSGQAVFDIHYTMAAAMLNHLVITERMHRWRDVDGAWLYQRR